MRIALFTDTFLPTVNGVARSLARFLDHAVGRGHEVGMVSTRVGAEPAPGAVFHHQVSGIPFFLYPELQAAGPLSRATKRQLEAFRPQVVWAVTEGLVGWQGRSWARRNGVPLVSSFCTDFPSYLADYGLKGSEGLLWFLLRTFHGPSCVVFCPSRATQEQLRERGFRNPLRLWTRGVDTDVFSPAFRDLELRRCLLGEAADDDGGMILLYVGRLAAEKRLDILLEAFRAIRQRWCSRVVLALAGDGPARPFLERMAGEGVVFLGYRRGEALSKVYASADLFVFPSDTETFGNVALEAMASGLPVVAPAKGGVQEIVIPHRTGVLVPPRDPAALAGAVLELLKAPAERARLAEGARRLAGERSWETILDRFLQDLSRVALHPSGPQVQAEGTIHNRSRRATFPWPVRHGGAVERPLS